MHNKRGAREGERERERKRRGGGGGGGESAHARGGRAAVLFAPPPRFYPTFSKVETTNTSKLHV